GTDRSDCLSGESVTIPHGNHLIRLHYLIHPKIATRPTDERFEDFIQGTTVSNTEVVQLEDNLGAVRGIMEGPGEYISRELDCSTKWRPRKAVLSFVQSEGGCSEFDNRLSLNVRGGGWASVGCGGRVAGITGG